MTTEATITEFTAGQFTGSRRMPAAIALAKATGGVYAEHAGGMSIDQALAAAGLDFTVTKAGPLSVPVAGATITGLDRMRATVATFGDGTPPRILGVVGRDYPVAQPAQAGEFGQILLDESGATVVAVCAYGDPRGSRMLLALKLPEGLKIGGVDPYDVYLYVGNSFNRETSLWGCVAPIRLDCTNQVAATFGVLASRFTIPHRGDMDSKVADARTTLGITGTFTERFRQAAEVMLATPMSPGEVTDFVAELMPTPTTVKTARGQDGWFARRGEIANMITDGAYNTFGRGTRYAAYQGVVEWADHAMRAATPHSRAARLVDGGAPERLKVHAAQLLLSGV